MNRQPSLTLVRRARPRVHRIAAALLVLAGLTACRESNRVIEPTVTLQYTTDLADPEAIFECTAASCGDCLGPSRGLAPLPTIDDPNASTPAAGATCRFRLLVDLQADLDPDEEDVTLSALEFRDLGSEVDPKLEFVDHGDPYDGVFRSTWFTAPAEPVESWEFEAGPDNFMGRTEPVALSRREAPELVLQYKDASGRFVECRADTSGCGQCLGPTRTLNEQSATACRFRLRFDLRAVLGLEEPSEEISLIEYLGAVAQPGDGPGFLNQGPTFDGVFVSGQFLAPPGASERWQFTAELAGAVGRTQAVALANHDAPPLTLAYQDASDDEWSPCEEDEDCAACLSGDRTSTALDMSEDQTPCRFRLELDLRGALDPSYGVEQVSAFEYLDATTTNRSLRFYPRANASRGEYVSGAFFAPDGRADRWEFSAGLPGWIGRTSALQLEARRLPTAQLEYRTAADDFQACTTNDCGNCLEETRSIGPADPRYCEFRISLDRGAIPPSTGPLPSFSTRQQINLTEPTAVSLTFTPEPAQSRQTFVSNTFAAPIEAAARWEFLVSVDGSEDARTEPVTLEARQRSQIGLYAETADRQELDCADGGCTECLARAEDCSYFVRITLAPGASAATERVSVTEVWGLDEVARTLTLQRTPNTDPIEYRSAAFRAPLRAVDRWSFRYADVETTPLELSTGTALLEPRLCDELADEALGAGFETVEIVVSSPDFVSARDGSVVLTESVGGLATNRPIPPSNLDRFNNAYFSLPTPTAMAGDWKLVAYVDGVPSETEIELARPTWSVSLRAPTAAPPTCDDNDVLNPVDTTMERVLVDVISDAPLGDVMVQAGTTPPQAATLVPLLDSTCTDPCYRGTVAVDVPANAGAWRIQAVHQPTGLSTLIDVVVVGPEVTTTVTGCNGTPDCSDGSVFAGDLRPIYARGDVAGDIVGTLDLMVAETLDRVTFRDPVPPSPFRATPFGWAAQAELDVPTDPGTWEIAFAAAPSTTVVPNVAALEVLEVPSDELTVDSPLCSDGTCLVAAGARNVPVTVSVAEEYGPRSITFEDVTDGVALPTSDVSTLVDGRFWATVFVDVPDDERTLRLRATSGGATGHLEFDVVEAAPLRVSVRDADTETVVERRAQWELDTCPDLEVEVTGDRFLTSVVTVGAGGRGAFAGEDQTAVALSHGLGSPPDVASALLPFDVSGSSPGLVHVTAAAESRAQPAGLATLEIVPVRASDGVVRSPPTMTSPLSASGTSSVTVRGQLLAPSGIESSTPFTSLNRVRAVVSATEAVGTPLACGTPVDARVLDCSDPRGDTCGAMPTEVSVEPDGSFRITTYPDICFAGELEVRFSTLVYDDDMPDMSCLADRTVSEQFIGGPVRIEFIEP